MPLVKGTPVGHVRLRTTQFWWTRSAVKTLSPEPEPEPVPTPWRLPVFRWTARRGTRSPPHPPPTPSRSPLLHTRSLLWGLFFGRILIPFSLVSWRWVLFLSPPPPLGKKRKKRDYVFIKGLEPSQPHRVTSGL